MDRDHNEVEAPTYLEKHDNGTTLKKIAKSIFGGFCPPFVPTTSDTANDLVEENDFKYIHDEKNGIDSSSSSLLNSQRKNSLHQMDHKNESDDINLDLDAILSVAPVTNRTSTTTPSNKFSNKETQIRGNVDLRHESTFPMIFSLIKMILSLFVCIYLLNIISYYHFGTQYFHFDSVYDLGVCVLLMKLRDAIEPYASTIVVAQLLLLPLYLLVGKGSIIYSQDSNRNDAEVSAGGSVNDGSSANLHLDQIGHTPNKSIATKEKKIHSIINTKKQPFNDMVFDNNDDTTSDISQKENKDKRNDINLDLDEATRNLPDPQTWKYRPVFIQPAGDTKCPGCNPNESLPLGIPFEFESNLFKGRVLFRLRNGKSDDPVSSKAYFDSTKLKLMRQLVIQGQFKRKTKMSEVWIGDIYDKKFKLSPPPTIARFIARLFSQLAPGVIIDMVSDKPKVLALLGSGSHTISVDKPGDEPDMMAAELPENIQLSNDIKTPEKRKQILSKPDTASAFEFDPDLVYTFHTNDEALDLAEYKFRIPILTMDFTRVLGDGQPMSFRAIHGDSTNSYFFFRVWHERTLVKAEEAKQRKGRLFG